MRGNDNAYLGVLLYSYGVDMASLLPTIIGIVGPIRAGKTTVTNRLVEKYGYNLASNSDVLRGILTDIGLEHSRENLGMLGDSLFSIFGNDLIARYRIECLHLGRVVVDGIRYKEELQRYRTVPGFKLLGIAAPPDIRFDRVLAASDRLKDLSLTRSKFDQMILSRSEIDVPDLLASADKIINNCASLDQLFLEVDKIIDGWTA